VPEVPALEPYYLPLDGPGGARFHATFSTTGPWFADAQHVGPPSALLARAVERCAPRPGTQIARFTVEVLGPVPAGDIRVTATVERPGRAIELVAAEMQAGGRAVLRARAWRTATVDTSAVQVGGAAPPAPPETVESHAPDMAGWLPGFVDSVEWRFLRGWFTEPGPGAAWIRQRIDLVEGERPSPLQRLAVVADSANGVAAPLDVREWLFVNTDLTLHLDRTPVGEWMGVDAATTVGPTGAGTVAGLLFDEHGQVGRSAQSLVVRPR
jgi:acyl-Coa thioesterase superfamily protein/acyl-CoA thioesterase superfamily protein